MLALAGIAAIFCRCRDDPALAEDELVVAWQLLRAKTKREPFSGAIYYGVDSGWR